MGRAVSRWASDLERQARAGGAAAPQAAEVYRLMYTFRVSKVVPVREFRSQLAQLLDEVVDRREHVTVTRHGRPAAVLIPVAEYEALEETAEILSDEVTLRAIQQGLADLAAGDVVPLHDVRAELLARRRD